MRERPKKAADQSSRRLESFDDDQKEEMEQEMDDSDREEDEEEYYYERGAAQRGPQVAATVAKRDGVRRKSKAEIKRFNGRQRAVQKHNQSQV